MRFSAREGQHLGRRCICGADLLVQDRDQATIDRILGGPEPLEMLTDALRRLLTRTKKP